MNVQKISETYSISAQIAPENVAEIAKMGFKSIICNRPDGEGMMQPSFDAIANAASEAGISAKHMPVAPGPAQLQDAQNLYVALIELEAPVFAYCGSGARAANLWNMCEENAASKKSAA